MHVRAKLSFSIYSFFQKNTSIKLCSQLSRSISGSPSFICRLSQRRSISPFLILSPSLHQLLLSLIYLPLLMWPPWRKHRPPRGRTSSPSPPPPRNKLTSSPSPLTISSSFKDVCTLVGDEADCFADAEDHCLTSPSPSRSRSPSPVLHRVRSASSALRQWRSPSEDPFRLPPGEEKRIVLYFTSLRVVRSTFNRCSEVRNTLRALRVAVDERDVSMDAGFLRELSSILASRRLPLSLPQVFIGGRHFGGADEIRRLYETGELSRYVEGAAPAAGPCEVCGDVLFLHCRRCNGSRRFYSNKGVAGFRMCTACNENGLVRCSRCYPSAAF